MTTLTIQEAQAQLEEIIHRLAPGDEVVITENNQPVARLVPTATQVAPEKFLAWALCGELSCPWNNSMILSKISRNMWNETAVRFAHRNIADYA